MITEYKNKVDKIIGFYRDHKRMPSYAEIMALVGFKSKNAVFKLVNKLVDEGILGKDSSGRLIPDKLEGFGAGLGGRNEVPLLGLVEAGFPSVAEGSADTASFDTINIDEYLIGGKAIGSTYLLEVKGDSMIDEGIREGDLVIAERAAGWGGDGVGKQARPEPKDGDIVIANIDGGWTMKYFRKRARRGAAETIYLEAANKKYKPIYPEESLRIAAIVKGVIRKY